MDKSDLKQIGDLIDAKLDKFGENIEEKMLKWKSEIVDSVDTLAKEMRDEREFREIGGHQISLNTKRIVKLEKKVFGAVQNEI